MITLFYLWSFFDLASNPVNNYSTYYNPASILSLAAYEILVAPSAIGQINFYSFSAHFGSRGLAFSGSQPPYAHKNWFSVYQKFKFPLSIGTNIGLEEEYNEKRIYSDLGFFSPLPRPWPGPIRLNLALVGYDLFDERHRTLRLGVNGRYRFARLVVELDDSIRIKKYIPYVAAAVSFGRKNVGFDASLGTEYKTFCAGLKLSIFNFGLGFAYLVGGDPAFRCHIALSFNERTIEKIVIKEKEVVKIKEVVVEKPIFIDRYIEKRVVKKQYKLTEKQQKFCERHYQLGIKYYIDGDLKQAIAEWEKVFAISPDYEDVGVNLKNTQEKLKAIEESEKNSQGNQNK